MLEGRQEDAYRYLQEAKQCLKRVNYAKALHEAQTCVELLTKDFLDVLGIPYKLNHDVSEKISKIPQKLEQPPFSTIVKPPHALKSHLAWLMILLKSLTAIRSALTYGEQHLKLGAQQTFSFNGLERGKLLAKTMVELTNETCENINPILEEIKTKIGISEDLKKSRNDNN